MNKIKYIKTGIMISLFLVFILNACSSANSEDQNYPNLTETFVYYTQAAQETQAAFSTVEAQLTESAQLLSETPAAVEPTPLPTIDETATAYAQATSVAASYSNQVCNWASFLEDMSFPDGTTVAPGQDFTKTWRFKNIGSCSWDKSYSILFSGGESFSANSVQYLDRLVRPGEIIDISVGFTAPQTPGTYMAYWIFSDGDGNLFGIGNEANGVFWVKVEVKK